ncbi:hypothetical protein DPMN_159674 [Dreissena polymorpha]|uniref:Uncharacterized protein n=1 Tax=Dreissena polymorpha TaxID=45954 RepID=A0A9D4EPM4_DREPO|nr:hypothetical protein DPMN_159674 [Dreissena polymorpha]
MGKIMQPPSPWAWPIQLRGRCQQKQICLSTYESDEESVSNFLTPDERAQTGMIMCFS